MINVGVAGRFKLEAVNEETGERRELTPWFNNLITDQGLNRLGTAGIHSNGSFCMVGTGSATPATTDTALASQLAVTSTTVSASNSGSASAPYYGSVTTVYRFAAGSATGNLTELGIGYSGVAVFSRTLIKDGNGNPTTITVLATEALDVTYELRLYPPAADVAHSTVISGVTYTGVIRASGVTSFSAGGDWAPAMGNSAPTLLSRSGEYARAYNGAIGPVTGSPSGTYVSINDCVTAAYSNNSYQRTGTTTVGLSMGNLAGGITAIRILTSAMGVYQISFSPAIPIDATKVLTFGLTLSWARMVI